MRGKACREREARLSQEKLLGLLIYDPETGVFRWRISWYCKMAGDIAGSDLKDGRRRLNIDGNLYYAHRVAWLYMMGVWPDEEIDHINRDWTDNRWSNLRAASHRENFCNIAKHKNNRSGRLGVCLDKRENLRKRYIVYIRDKPGLKGGRFLGRYETLEEAAAVYEDAAIAARGGFFQPAQAST